MKLFTIGHSNHSIETFIDLLKQYGITALADVRSSPHSRYVPHFNQTPLKNALLDAGIAYVFLGSELGARPDDASCYVDGKALYERIAATEAFQTGIQRVLKGVATHNIALMCAEKDPITCHRTILVCQQLRSLPLEIHHILSDGALETHSQLEARLLKLHKLAPTEPSEFGQLNLFSDAILSSQPTVPQSGEDLLKEAYQRQGDRIAYVEKQEQPNEPPN
jgi:uncharacterized protein (DUF488 family)